MQAAHRCRGGNGSGMPNLAAPMDAPIAPLFHCVHFLRRASEQRR